MGTLRRRVVAAATACLLLALGGAGCSETGGGFDLASLVRPPGTPQIPAPAPNSPANTLRLLEWVYLGGNADQPAASSTSLKFDRNFFVDPDPDFTYFPEPNRTMPRDPLGRWHKNIRTTVNLRIGTEDGASIEISGHANFEDRCLRGPPRCALRTPPGSVAHLDQLQTALPRFLADQNDPGRTGVM